MNKNCLTVTVILNGKRRLRTCTLCVRMQGLDCVTTPVRRFEKEKWLREVTFSAANILDGCMYKKLLYIQSSNLFAKRKCFKTNKGLEPVPHVFD